MTGEMSVRQFLAATAALLVLAGVLYGGWVALDGFGTGGSGGSGPAPGADAAATVDAYAQAWTVGDHLTMAGFVREPPPDFTAIHQQLRDALQPRSLTVEVTEVVSDVDGRALATLRVTLQPVGPAAPEIVWDSEVVLLRERGEWAIAWEHQSLHPDLRPGLVFDTESTSVDRSPILAADGTELAGGGTRVTFGFEPSAVTNPDAVVAAFEAALPGSGRTAERLLDRDDLVDGWFYPVVTVSQAAADTASQVLREAGGILRQTETGRMLYADDFAVHIVGRYEEATAEDLERLGPPYEPGDEVGRTGLERTFERELTGSDEISIVLRDVADGAVRAVLATYQEQPSGPLQTTLDIVVQQAIENTLRGVEDPVAIVAVDAATGAIRGSASRPLSGYNRALEGRYPPGSTFKVVTAEALLADGLTPGSQVPCPGDTIVGGLAVTNAGTLDLGDTSLTEAFARSCNTTFARLGADLGEEAMLAAAERFGFGIDPLSPLTAAGGSFPEPVDTAELAAASFGQARVTASTLHLAAVAAATDTGVWRQPYLLVEDGPGESRQLASGVVEPLRALMRAVVTDGTGAAADVDGLDVRGKTGTAQAEDGVEHAWFVGTFDGLGFAVLVEGGGAGGQVAAPFAARFVSELAAIRAGAAPAADAEGEDDEDVEAEDDEG